MFAEKPVSDCTVARADGRARANSCQSALSIRRVAGGLTPRVLCVMPEPGTRRGGGPGGQSARAVADEGSEGGECSGPEGDDADEGVGKEMGKAAARELEAAGTMARAAAEAMESP